MDASEGLIKLNFSLAATENYKDCTNFNEIEYQARIHIQEGSYYICILLPLEKKCITEVYPLL